MRGFAKAVLLGGVAIAIAIATASCSGADRPPPSASRVPEPAAPSPGQLGDKVIIGSTWKGTVLAPNGSIPLANALVYVTSAQPAPLPDAAYCDECVTLDPGSYSVSAADGTFEIKNIPVTAAYVVVQKGQFRRVRPLTRDPGGGGGTGDGLIGAGKLTMPDDALTLAGKSDTAKGDHVPTMAVLFGDLVYDLIDTSLTKLGITGFERLKGRSLLSDPTSLMRYQIVFLPCGEEDDPAVSTPAVLANMQRFVRAGGRLYVTDYSYEFVRQPFPGFLSWQDESAVIGSAAGGEWDGPATAVDPALAGWLAATGDHAFDVLGNWTTITGIHTKPGLDPKGAPATILPKVWIAAKTPHGFLPTTVSFEDQCGRVLFSTYHTEADVTNPALLAQEKALLHVLLEVGVCIGNGTAPPGVR